MASEMVAQIYLACQGAAVDLRESKKWRHRQIALVLDEMAWYLQRADLEGLDSAKLASFLVDGVKFHIS